MSYCREDNESELDFVNRICGIKDVLGTWQQVADIINHELNTNRSESYYRKLWSGTYHGRYVPVKPVNRKDITDDENISDIDLKAIELEKERRKLQTTKVEYNKMLRLESRFELFYETVAEKIEKMPIPEYKPMNCMGDDNMEYVLTISDIHLGAKFESENNKYSIEICKNRFEKLSGYIKNFVQEHSLSKLKIVTLGDCIQGILRMTDLKLNEISVVESVVVVSRLIASFLNDLSSLCNIEYYHTPTSNHTQTRPLGTSRNEIPSEDVEYIIGNYIKDMLTDNDRVKINLNFGKNHIDFKIYDFNCTALHGHTLKNINRSLRDLSTFYKKFYDFVFLGHFHSGTELTSGENLCNDTEILISPSFIGSDPYSDSLMLGSKASVKLYGFEEVNGHVETYKFVLN